MEFFLEFLTVFLFCASLEAIGSKLRPRKGIDVHEE